MCAVGTTGLEIPLFVPRAYFKLQQLNSLKGVEEQQLSYQIEENRKKKFLNLIIYMLCFLKQLVDQANDQSKINVIEDL